MKLWLILLLLFVIPDLHAQSSKKAADSLRSLLKTSTGQALVQTQYKLASYLVTIDDHTADSLIERALVLSDSMGYEVERMLASIVKSSILSIRGDYDKSEALLLEIKNKAQSTNQKNLLTKAHTALGALYTKQGRYELAIANQLEALELAEDQELIDVQVTNLLNIGLIKQDLGALEEASKYLSRGLALTEEHDLQFRSGQVCVNLGVLEFVRNNVGLSIEYNLKALDIFKSFGDKGQQALCLQNLGYAEASLGNLARANELYDSSIKLREEIGDLRGIARIYLNKARHFIQAGELQKGIGEAEQGLALAREIVDLRLQQDLSQVLFQAYESVGQVGQALAYYKAYSITKDSLVRAYNEVKIAELTKQYEYDQQQKTLQLSQQELAASESKTQLLETQRLLLSSALFLLFIVFLLIYLVSRNKIARMAVEKKLSVEEKKNSDYQNQLLTQERGEMLHKVSEQEQENARLREELELQHKQLANHTLYLIQKNELLGELKDKLSAESSVDDIKKSIDRSISSDSDWGKFQEYFDKVHIDFFNRLNDEFEGLTPADIRLSTLLRLNKNTKEIATLLGISPQSVNIARHRLRKKLNLSSDQNLTSFILKY